jgi:hypothetical protein
MEPAGLLENDVTSDCEETPAPSLLARNSGQQIVDLTSHILHRRQIADLERFLAMDHGCNSWSVGG